VSKALGRFRLKFSKANEEAFSPSYGQVIEVHCTAKLQEDQYERLIQEIRKNKTSEKAIVEPILSSMAELAEQVKAAVELTKAKSSQLKEPRDLSNEIMELLDEKELTFTQILRALNTTATTLTKYLEQLLAESRIERREVGPNVLYRLKRIG
jgi:predicted transcriptional regulator